MNLRSLLIGALCALTIGVYASIAWGRHAEMGNTRPEDAYYNLQVAGFRSGHLYLGREAPAGLAALPDPYDPVANSRFRGAVYVEPGRVHDLSYFGGRLYLYFGVTPVVLLFWPYSTLTGHYLGHQQAVVVFASIGFLASVGMLLAAWRRYFARVPLAVVAIAILSLGLGNGMPIMLSRPDVWEVPVAAGGALVMLALCALWRAIHGGGTGVSDPGYSQRTVAGLAEAGWLALASLLFGLAIGARPSLLFCSAALLIPVILARKRRVQATSPTSGNSDGRAGGLHPPRSARLGSILAAAVLPIAAIGIGLAIYNYQRFGSITEFGQQYQLAGDRQDRNHFSLGFLLYNFRMYFLAPAQWSGSFPFVAEPAVPRPPAGHGGVEGPYGLLVNMPFALLAFALPLALKRAEEGFRFFAAAAGWVFLASAVTMGLFYGTCFRYELEFSPPLFFLAGLGALGLDATLTARRALSPVAGLAARVGLLALALFSVALNQFAGAKLRGDVDSFEGTLLSEYGRDAEAIPVLEEATRLVPAASTPRLHLALMYWRASRPADAEAQLAESLRREPDGVVRFCDQHAETFLKLGRGQEIVQLLDAALRLTPNSAALHNQLGATRAFLGRVDLALAEFENAVQLEPRSAIYLGNNAGALAQLGRLADARTLLQRALAIDPNYIDARDLLRQISPPAAGGPPPLLIK